MSTHNERTTLMSTHESPTGHGSIQTIPASAAWDNKQVDLAVSSSDKESAAFRGEVRATLDDKASLAIVLFDVLLVDTARGIFFPTLWAHIKQLGGDKIALGYCVGAFSLGRTLMSPVFGRMSTKHGYRRVLMISSALVILGALFYAVADGVFEVFLSQVFLGVGSGTLGVTRGYVADKTTPAQRTYLLAYTTAVQYAGFTVMPVLGGFFSYILGSAEIPLIGRFLMLTQYTAPAFFVTAMAAAVFVLLWSVFQDGVRNQSPAGKTSSAKDLSGASSGVSLVPTLATEAGSSDDGDGDSGDDSRSVVGQYIEISSDGDGDIGQSTTSLGSCAGGENAAVEDLEGGYQAAVAGSGAGEGEKKGRGEEAALFEGEEGWLARKLRLRLPSRGDMLIYGGFLLNVSTKGTISCFETIGAEYAMTNFSLTSAEAGSMFATCGAIGVGSLLCMRLLCRHFNDIQLVLGGIALMIATCVALAFPIQAGPAGVHLFVVAVFLMYSVGYPIGHTAVLGLFSKVVGAQPQGTLMGWFGSAGALARTFFPVVAGVLSQELGSSALFVFLVVILSVTFALLFTFRKPYLECVEITKRRKAAVAPAVPSSGTTTSAAK